MTVYHNEKNLTNGRVRVSWNGVLLCTCDGSDADERYILDMLKDEYRKHGSTSWVGHIRKIPGRGWKVIDSPLLIH